MRALKRQGMLSSMNAPAQAELGRATLESKMKTIVWVTRPSAL